MPNCNFCEQPIPFEATACPHCGAPIDESSQSAASEIEQQIEALLQQGKKIEAITLYRESTDSNLLQAKQAVEAFQEGKGLSLPPTAATSALSLDLDKYDLDENLEDQIIKLLASGEKLRAVKLYREQTGAGLKDSKEAVERLSVGHGLQHLKLEEPGVGCAGLLVYLFIIALISVAVLLLVVVFGLGT